MKRLSIVFLLIAIIAIAGCRKSQEENRESKVKRVNNKASLKAPKTENLKKTSIKRRREEEEEEEEAGSPIETICNNLLEKTKEIKTDKDDKEKANTKYNELLTKCDKLAASDQAVQETPAKEPTSDEKNAQIKGFDDLLIEVKKICSKNKQNNNDVGHVKKEKKEDGHILCDTIAKKLEDDIKLLDGTKAKYKIDNDGMRVDKDKQVDAAQTNQQEVQKKQRDDEETD